MDGYFKKKAPNSQSSRQEGRAVTFPSLLLLVLFLFLLLCGLLLDVFLAFFFFFLSSTQTQ